MSLGVLNNVAAIYAQNNLNQTQSSLQSTLTQLSSGSRINSGADDAAGLAVADGLHANVAALTQSSQNASDGIGLLQTADGALSQVTNLLNRAVTLATEAANGTLNSNQVSSANQEYQNILSEIGNIGSKTNFNGNAVFSNTAKTVFVSDGTASGANVYSETVGSLSASGVGIAAPGATTTSLLAATPTAPVVGTSGGSSAFAALTTGQTVGGTFTLQVGSTGTAYSYTIAPGSSASDAATSLTAQLSANNVTGVTVTSAGGVLKIASTATTGGRSNRHCDGQRQRARCHQRTDHHAGRWRQLRRGRPDRCVCPDRFHRANRADQRYYGDRRCSVSARHHWRGYQRAVRGFKRRVVSESENLTSAESSIRSTNYGQATSDLAKYQVLSQTGISALAQANSVQQEVLKLLQ